MNSTKITRTCVYVLMHYIDVAVTVRSAVFMPETYRVHDLMDNNSFIVAASSQRNLGKTDLNQS